MRAADRSQGSSRFRAEMSASAADRDVGVWLSGPLAAQGDVVGFGDGVGLDGSEAVAKALAGLPQQVERVGGRTPRSSALWGGPVLLDEVRLKGRSDFIGCLERLVDGLVPRSVVNHAANVNTRRGARVAGPAFTGE
jgi:hypothetical protein